MSTYLDFLLESLIKLKLNLYLSLLTVIYSLKLVPDLCIFWECFLPPNISLYMCNPLKPTEHVLSLTFCSSILACKCVICWKPLLDYPSCCLPNATQMASSTETWLYWLCTILLKINMLTNLEDMATPACHLANDVTSRECHPLCLSIWCPQLAAQTQIFIH